MTLPLSYADHGAGPPLLILHGMLGSSGNWRSVAKRLGSACHVFALDLRNHGQSPRHERMSYVEMAEDVAEFVRQQKLNGVTVLGHSMGGKTAMMMALEHGSLVERLIVVDIAPVDYPSDHLDYIRAMQAIDLSEVKNRAQADAALRQHVPQIGIRRFLLRSLMQRDGHYEWSINLSSLALNMQQLSGFPELSADHRYEGKTYFIHGALSNYVQPEHEKKILELFPKARILTIRDAAHWVHYDQPDAFIECVFACLENPT